jgi:hypothetical protein
MLQDGSAVAILKDRTVPLSTFHYNFESIPSPPSRASFCAARQASVTATVAIGVTLDSHSKVTGNHT